MSVAFTAFLRFSHCLAKHPKRIHKSFMRRRKSKRHSGVRGFLHRLRYWLAAYALRTIIAALAWLPERVVVSASSFFSWITHKLLWEYRIRMEENIAGALGDRFPGAVATEGLSYGACGRALRGLCLKPAP